MRLKPGILAVLSIAVFSYSAVRQIPYSGGLMSGTVDLRGTAADTAGTGSGSGILPDTLVIEGGVRLVVFTEVWNSRQYSYLGPRRHWYFLTNTEGPIGFLSFQDTVWTSAQVFPSGPLSSDTIKYNPDPVLPDQMSPANLTGTHTGLQVGTWDYGGLGYPIRFTLTPGHKRIVYFRMAKPGGTSVYGKLMIYDTTISRASGVPVTDGPRLELLRTKVALTLSSSTDINSGAVVGVAQMIRSVSNRNRRLVWFGRDGVLVRDERNPDRLYDLTGKRFTPGPFK